MFFSSLVSDSARTADKVEGEPHRSGMFMTSKAGSSLAGVTASRRSLDSSSFNTIGLSIKPRQQRTFTRRRRYRDSSLLTLAGTRRHTCVSVGGRIDPGLIIALTEVLLSAAGCFRCGSLEAEVVTSSELFTDLCKNFLKRWKLTSFAIMIVVVVVVIVFGNLDTVLSEVIIH